jgi:uncharacterized protein involved in exopolysaccharide biosynthesis
MKYYETLYELLAKQYEVAKIDEAKNATLVQILDRAEPPERKSKPRRWLISLLLALTAGFMAVIWVFFREALSRARKDSEQLRRLRLFNRYLKGE